MLYLCEAARLMFLNDDGGMWFDLMRNCGWVGRWIPNHDNFRIADHPPGQPFHPAS
jgi:hypothetical protein